MKPGRPNSSDFDWTTLTPETFELLAAHFHVNKGKALIVKRPRKVHLLPVADWKGMAELIEYEKTPAVVDTSFPCILAAIGNGFLPIDGWHRIRNALRDGIEAVPAVRLTKRETKAIRLD